MLPDRLVPALFAALTLLPATGSWAQAGAPDAKSVEGKSTDTKAADSKVTDGKTADIKARQASEARINDAATWLAGLQVDPSPDLARAQKDTDAAWSSMRNTRLAAMADFAKKHFAPERADCGTLFYPFSGPDILNAISLFPACRQYVLFGLEPVGELPPIDRMNAEQKAAVLEDMHRAQQNMLRRNFFVTRYMSTDLNTPNLKGVLPIMVAMLARMGYDVLDIVPGKLDGTAPPAPGTRTRSARVHFALHGGGPVQEIFYASFDASDEGLERHPEFLTFMHPVHPTLTLMKAASYLLHDKTFLRMRTLIAEKSPLIIQDDSGMPYAELLADGFTVELYGSYVGTIPVFNYRYQKDLAAAYQALPTRTNLPFAWSYAWKPSEESLQVARKKAS